MSRLSASLVNLLLLGVLTRGFVLLGTPFPPNIVYTEGRNTTMRILTDLQVNGTEPTVSVLVSLYFNPSNTPVLKALNASFYMYTGPIPEVNQRLSELTVTMDQYENRRFYVEVRASIGGTVRTAGVTLIGVANNTASYLDGLTPSITFDGSTSIVQKIDSTFWGAFVDTYDTSYGVYGPITTATLSCTDIEVLPRPTIGYTVAKAGGFTLRGTGRLTSAPKCEVWVSDVDETGGNALLSARYPVDVIFTPRLSRLEEFKRWATSLPGILTWLGLAWSLKAVVGYIGRRNNAVAPIATLVANRYKVNVWRMCYTKRTGEVASADVVPYVSNTSRTFVRMVDNYTETTVHVSEAANRVMDRLLDSHTVVEYTGWRKWVWWCLRCKYYVQTQTKKGTELQSV